MPTTVKLIGVEGPFKGKSRILIDGEYILGRDNDCDIPIPDPKVSKRHARLRISNPEVTIEDLDSLNGTYMGDARRGNSVIVEVLQDGDIFALGPNVVFGIQILQLRSAGFWVRFGAAVIDGLILGVVGVLGGLLIRSLIDPYLQQGASMGPDIQVMQTAVILNGLWQLMASFAYMVLMNGSRGQTLGKMALGLKITHQNGQAISYGTAFFRYFIQWLLVVAPLVIMHLIFPVPQDPRTLLGLLPVAVVCIFLAAHPEKRAWYDLLADTRVVHVKSRKA